MKNEHRHSEPDGVGGGSTENSGEDVVAIFLGNRDGLWAYALGITGCAHDAEDALQSALLNLMRRKAVIEIGTVPFVYRCVRNAAADQHRSRARRRRREKNRAVTTPGVRTDSAVEMADSLNGEVARLPEDLREIVILKLRSDLTFDQIAGALGKPRGTVTGLYRRAIGRLRESMSKDPAVRDVCEAGVGDK